MTEMLMFPISFGEAADKISILQIKRERIAQPEKLANVERELAQAAPLLFENCQEAPEFQALFAKLRNINQRLWDIEEALRECEQRQDFGSEFIRLARAVYLTNEERSETKRDIDLLFNSPIVEEKSYIRRNRPSATDSNS
jgi:hypothetical protein